MSASDKSPEVAQRQQSRTSSFGAFIDSKLPGAREAIKDSFARLEGKLNEGPGTSLGPGATGSSPGSRPVARSAPQAVPSRSRHGNAALDAGLPAASFTGRRPQVRLGVPPSPGTPAQAAAPAKQAGGGPAAAPPAFDIEAKAAELGVPALYLAVLYQEHDLVKKMLRPGSKMNVNTAVDAHKVSPASMGQVARLPRKPGSALELAVALSDVAMVELLMEHGATLQIPRLLSLEELRAKAKLKAAPSGGGGSGGGGGVRRGGQLAGFGDEDDFGVFSAAFLEDEEVQRTLGWQDYEAQLLVHTDPAIVERILKRQGYQLTLSPSKNPHELAQLFEKALVAGNAYVLDAMAAKGVGVNAPTFRREQFPLCVAINTLQPAMVDKILAMGGSLHEAETAEGHLYEQGAGGGAAVQRWYPLPDALLMLANVCEADGWPDLQHEPVPDERLGVLARITETLLAHGAAPSADLVDKLARRAPLASAPPELLPGYKQLLRILLGQVQWSPDTHIWFPFAFKEEVQVALLCSVEAEASASSGGALKVPAAIVEEEEEGEEEDGLAAGELPQQQAAAAAAVQQGVAALSLSSSSKAGTAGEVRVLVDGAEGGEGDEQQQETEEERIAAMFSGVGEEDLARICGMLLPISKWLDLPR